MSASRRLLHYMRRYRVRYAAGAACLVAATVLSLGIPWTVKSAVDLLGHGGSGSALFRHVAVILALAAGHGLARLGSRFTMIGAGQWVEHDIRRDLYGRLQQLPPAYYQTQRTGDLMSRASNDVSAVRALAGFGATMLTQTSFAFTGTLCAMWLIDPWLTLYALSPFPALVLLAKRFGHAVETESTAVQEQLGALSAKVQENLTGMAVVRAYTMEGRETERFRGLNREYLERSLRLARTQSAYWPFMGFVSGLGTLVVLWLGGKAVVDGRISLGGLVAFNGYLGYLAWPTMALGWTLASVRRGLASMGRIAEILDAPVGTEAATADCTASAGTASEPQAMTESSGREHVRGEVGRRARVISGPIEFRDLTFAYDGRAAALSGVSFTVAEGALVVVVGATGSGKSTLGLLLCRLFEPPAGSLLIGGTDVRDLPLAALRRAVGYVPQEPFLFSRSIRDNLLFEDDAATHEQMMAAVRAAGLVSEVEAFPEGWDTVVGERGLTLSGGQRQRASLARALVGDPRILVLDDPFASVDAGTESEILAAIRAARGNRTTLLMTHRLRAAQEADWVVVLDGGRVVEQGTHAELLRVDGIYARLWRMQQIEAELDRA